MWLSFFFFSFVQRAPTGPSWCHTNCMSPTPTAQHSCIKNACGAVTRRLYTVFNQLSTSAYKSVSDAAFFTLDWRNDIVLRGVRSNRGVVQRARWPYRGVEVALAVHGDVEPRLGALDGHYSESHRNQVELHCKKKRGTMWCQSDYDTICSSDLHSPSSLH